MYGDLNKNSHELDSAPHETNKSKLFIKSIGRAAMNIDDNNPKLEVIPLEDLGYVDGEINTEKQKLDAQGTDHTGNAYNVSVDTSNTLLATWLPIGTNRLTVPHVRRGERVLIWQYGDVDEYYWSPLGWDDHLRKLETITHAVSNTKDEDDVKLTIDNTYTLEMSTHTGQITLTTSKSNGEKYAYIMQVNAKDGVISITDDKQNFIQLDSNESSVILHNTKGSLLEVIGNDINIHCSGNVSINASSMKVNANTAFTGSLTSNGKNISDSHMHSNVSKGPSNTGSVS